MSEALKFRLDDGTEFDAYIEDEETAEDLLRTAGRTRIAVEESDVEAHGMTPTLRVVVYGPDDDVEGHSMTLRLPHPDAARELQRKLLAAGVVGVLVVGAATTSVWVADNVGAGQAASDTPVAAPAPWWVNPAVRDGGGADATTPSVTTPAAPDWVNPANRDQFHPSISTPVEAAAPAAPDWVNPANRDQFHPSISTPVEAAAPIAPASVDPAARDQSHPSLATPAVGSPTATTSGVDPAARDQSHPSLATPTAPSASVPVPPASANPAVRDGGGADATATDEAGANPVNGPQRAR